MQDFSEVQVSVFLQSGRKCGLYLEMDAKVR